MSFFAGASNVVVKDSQIVNRVSRDDSKWDGLQKLRAASILGAAHDSSERYPPPICHPGTREGYVENLTKWGLNADNHVERITWVKGPAGVGKSAIAQSCAEGLGDKLGASFFFSRPNHRDDPNRFFTSLACQLSEKFTHYGTLLDQEIRRRPTLLKKALPHQFRDLLVIPFTNPTIKEEVGEQVIIVDGLDECARKEAQVDIIKIVEESTRTRTTPFLWIFLSRLEPDIVKTFDLPFIKSASQQIDLPVSRAIDQEILRYLADNLQEIGRKHDLALPWPSEKEVWALVDFSAGLFACAHAIIFFIKAESPAGPVELLNVVLALAKRSTKQGSNHRLSALDELYTLVMERIPSTMLQTVQWILLTTCTLDVPYADQSASLSGLSELQFRNAGGYLHSVLEVGTGSRPQIAFYHASFMDFIEDPTRSGCYSIWSECAVTLLEVVLRHLDQIQVAVDKYGRYCPRLNLTWNMDHTLCYRDHLVAFFKLLASAPIDNDKERFRAWTDFDFRKFAFDIPGEYRINEISKIEITKEKLGSLKLLHTSLRFLFPGNFYRIGHGKKSALLEIQQSVYVGIKPYSTRDFRKWAKQIYMESNQPQKQVLEDAK